MLINALVIGIVIWIAGTSVKDFACNLVNQFHMVGEDKKEFFNQTMDYYLLRASFASILIAGLIYYYLTRKVVSPLHRLKESTKELSKGRYPELLKVESSDEVGELTEQFNELIHRLQKTENNRSKILSDMAHELRTPLSNINGYLEGLSNGVIRGDLALYQSLHKESLRLTALIEKLYLLNEQEHIQLQHKADQQKVNMKDLIEGCMKLFEWDFKQHGIQYSYELEEGYVIGDVNSFKQVINNLIQNAIQYKTEETKIVCQGFIEENMYYISITGEGQWIPEEQRDKIFERFHRVDPSRNRDTGGDGLGLCIVKEIAEHHGGRAGLDTDGSTHTFWVRFPLSLE